MKILINLVGLSHHDIGNGLHSYKNVHETLFKNVVNPLREKNEVDFFLTTYHTQESENLKNIYNPIKSIYRYIEPNENHGNIKVAFNTYKESIYELKNLDYDFYIVTRFDLWIGTQLNLDFNKFNFLFKELEWWDTPNNHQCTTDTFYAFPKFMLDGFIKGIEDCINKNGEPGYIGLFHKLYPDLINYINENDIHFIDDEKQTVQISNKYKLSRYL